MRYWTQFPLVCLSSSLTLLLSSLVSCWVSFTLLPACVLLFLSDQSQLAALVSHLFDQGCFLSFCIPLLPFPPRVGLPVALQLPLPHKKMSRWENSWKLETFEDLKIWNLIWNIDLRASAHIKNEDRCYKEQWCYECGRERPLIRQESQIK